MIIAPNPRRSATLAAVLAPIVAVALSIVLVATAAGADPLDDQARLEQEMLETRVAMEAASQRVADAGVAFAQANALIPQAQQMLADAQAALAQAQEKAAPAQARVDEVQVRINQLAVRTYMGGDVASLDAMLAARTPEDFIIGLTYLEYVGVGQRQAIDERKAAGADVLEAYAAAKLAEEQAAAAQNQLTALLAQREQALKIAQDEAATTEQRWLQLAEENERVAAEVRSMASGGGPVVNPGSKLLMPVIGRKSSNFGNRLDPIYGVWRLHAGIDVSAPGGTDIWAAAGGEVFRAGWSGGYGNYTCIYHGLLNGTGFATCYAHQSAIVVSVGQQVNQGQVIGRVGTTGDSTGNHLHFEVRLDGNPVDPLEWLPTCLC